MNDREYTLLFVYNADSGLFNTMADIGHKRAMLISGVRADGRSGVPC